MSIEDPGPWRRPTAFVDSDTPAIVAFARAAAGSRADARERAIALYYAVRDGVTYTPYCDFRSLDTYRASAVLTKGAGFCVGKAALLAAVARAEGIPARLRFADVRNHLCTPRLRASSGVTSSTITASWSSSWSSGG
jgi:transglutaminase-like putative cysteine protease